MELKNQIIDRYLTYLKNDIKVEKSNGKLIYSLPFFISGGHFIEITVSQLHGNYVRFSDESRTIGDLFLSGLEIKKHRHEIEKIIKTFQLEINEKSGEITAIGTLDNAGEILHRIITSSIQLGRMELLRTLKMFSESTFVRKIKKIIDTTKIEYKFMDEAIIKGKKIKEIRFDFLIQNGKLKAIKAIDRKQHLDIFVAGCAFEFEDFKCVYPDADRIVIYNPENEQWSKYSYILEENKIAKTIPFEENRIKEVVLSKA